MKPIRIIITGAGSGVGQGIIKALRASELTTVLIAADVSPMNCALYRTDDAVLFPKVESTGSLANIIRIFKAKKPDVIMIGSEFDLEFFARHREQIEAETKALIIVSPLQTVQISEDKWLTAEFLRENGLPHAESRLPLDRADAEFQANGLGFPLVLKTRTGTSSRHVHVVQNRSELESLYDLVPNPMLQKMIDLPSNQLKSEYTCSVFKCKDGTSIGPFTARRTLRGGSSWIVEVDEFKELHSLLLRIAEKLPTYGSLNVQLMIGKNGPVPFEFNARFSGTTAVRAHFGFNEPEMAVRHYYLGETLKQPTIRKGLAMRYLEEVFIEAKSANELQEPFPKGTVRTWF